MKKYILLLTALFFLSCGGGKTDQRFGLVIHGGAGTITRENMSAEKEAAYRVELTAALKTGYAILDNGGSSLDAVEAVVRVMEDSPLFNAGKGAVFTGAGTNELDASIMDGATHQAGAVAGVKTVKNPISAARKVMEETWHVLLASDGADAFAEENPFIQIMPEGQLPDLRSTVHSNRCAIGWASDSSGCQWLVQTSIDNLVKGASGQAIQNMNLMFGLHETCGLS